MATTAAPITAAPKISWLKHVGNFLGKILKITAKDAAPVADEASKVAALMFPQFAPEISAADNLVDNIAKEALAAEVMEQAGSAVQGGTAKAEAVLAASGPAIDQWVASRFPGADAVATAKKANLIQAIFYIIDDVKPPTGLATATDTTAKAA